MSAASEPLLIWGAGAMGGTIGAYLARAGRPVTLVDGWAEHVAAIREKGLTITGSIDEFTTEVEIVTPEELTGSWRLAVLAIASQHTDDTCRRLAPHLADDGAVMSVQNGENGEIMASHFGRERAYAAVGTVAGEVLEPGTINFSIGRHPMPIGQIDGDNGPIVDELVEAITPFAADSYATDEIQGHLWQKHLFNMITAPSSIATSPLGDIGDRDDLRPLWVGLIREVIAVAEAHGTPPLDGGTFRKADFAPDAPLSASDPYFAIFKVTGTEKGKPYSQGWRDIAIIGRKTEGPTLLEPIADLGERYGVPTPLLRATVDMIRAVEDGRRPQDDKNLYEILTAGTSPAGASSAGASS